MELVRPEPAELQQGNEPSMLSIVMRAVSDPTIDPARLREFLQIGRELEADRAKRQYNQAWAQMMPQMPVITKEGRIEYKPGTKPTQFARWDDIHKACMPILHEYGFAVSFDSENADNRLTVIVKITHTAGHQECPRFTVPWLDTGGSKSPAQQAASSFTVAQRHAFCKAFNVLTRDEDDDGSGKGFEHISAEQAQTIIDVVEECTNRDPKFKANFAKWLKAEFYIDTPMHLFQGPQHKAVMAKLSEKQKLLGMMK